MIFKNVDELLKNNKSEINFSTINGVFDLLHEGHRDAINQCLAKVEKLTILVNSDKSTNRIKGQNRPIEKIEKRLMKLHSFYPNCNIVQFHELTPVKVLSKLNPKLHFYSDDWGEDLVEMRYLRNTEFIKVVKNIDISTTSIINSPNEIVKKAIILDRDGTITVDKRYKNNIDNFEFKNFSIEGLKSLYDQGFLLFVVSNQSGVTKGLVTKKDVNKFNNKMKKDLAAEGVEVVKFYTSYSSDENSIYRKPNNKFAEIISDNYKIALKESWVIGDKDSDILFGKLSNCKTIRISSSYAKEDKSNYFVDNLLEASNKILNHS